MKKPTILVIAVTVPSFAFCHAAESQTAPKGATPPSGKKWIIETQEDWESNAATKSGMEFQDGMAVPSAPSATFVSKIKSFDQKQTPRSLVVSQSPVWDNWQAVPKIAPPNLGDAPVLLTKGPGDYWIFGLYSNKQPATNFIPQEGKLKGFEIPLQTTQWPNQFNAPGGLKRPLGG